MRILFIHNRYQYRGGEDVAVEQEASLLQEKGHQVETLIFSNDQLSGLLGKVKAGLQSIYNRQSAAKLNEAIEQFKPDLIHVHNIFFSASPSVLYVAGKRKIPVVYTLHNYRHICANALLLRENSVCELCIQKRFPWEAIKYKCYRNSAVESALVTAITGIHKSLHTWQNKVSTYIALNEFTRYRMQGTSMKVPEHKMQVKPNFVKDPGNGAWPRENFLLYVGRLSPEKGVETMLKAISGMPQCRLVVAGDGPEREALTAAYGSFANIEFKGSLPAQEVISLLQQCQLLVFPSIWYEGLPFTILEAFATGTPVLASNLGSMQQMITNGYNGFHFQPGNANDLSDKLNHFLAMPEAGKKELYQQARKTYLEKYHPEVNYQAILTIYQNALQSINH